MPAKTAFDSGIYKSMQEIYEAQAPATRRVAPKLLIAVLEPALRISLDSGTKPANPESGIPWERRDLGPSTQCELSVDPKAKGFVTELLQPTLAVPGEYEQEFFFNIVSVIGKGLMQSAVQVGIQALSNLCSSEPESAMEEDSTTGYLDLLSKRALLGEAALQALTTLPPKTTQPKGFLDYLDTFKTTVQTIGTQVLKTAPMVIKAVKPIVIDLLKQKLQDTAAPSPVPGPSSLQTLKPPKQSLRSSPSLMDVLDGVTELDPQYDARAAMPDPRIYSQMLSPDSDIDSNQDSTLFQ